MHVAAAAAAGGVRHLVLRSFTAVYGARGQNPNFLTEDRKPDGNARLAWVRDKVEAEEQAFSFARRYTSLGVTVLRFATLLGPGCHTFYTRLFSKPRRARRPRVRPAACSCSTPTTPSTRPRRRSCSGPSGVVNVVPRGTMSLLTMLHLADKLTVAVPHVVAYPLADMWWGGGLGEAPGGFIDYVRFLFVADGEKARRELGFEARYTTREALMAFLEYRYPDTARLAREHTERERAIAQEKEKSQEAQA